jgi:hypothetical protein
VVNAIDTDTASSNRGRDSEFLRYEPRDRGAHGDQRDQQHERRIDPGLYDRDQRLRQRDDHGLIVNDGALSTTNSFALTVTAVNDLPAFTVSTNLVLVAEDAGSMTNASFLTGISTGPRQ